METRIDFDLAWRNQSGQERANSRRFGRAEIEFAVNDTLPGGTYRGIRAIKHRDHLIAIGAMADEGHRQTSSDQFEEISQDADTSGPVDQPRPENRYSEAL